MLSVFVHCQQELFLPLLLLAARVVIGFIAIFVKKQNSCVVIVGKNQE